MKVFKARPGVVLLEVCGEHILVATGEAREKCPNVFHINDRGAKLWELILAEQVPGKIVKRAQEELALPPADALRSCLVFFSKLTDAGYLLQEDIP